MFTGNIRLGKIMGIPILLDYSWFIIFFLLTLQYAQDPFLLASIYNPFWRYGIAAITAILIFASVLLHELGHSYVAIRRGISIRRITLFIFGGIAETAQEPRTAIEEFEIAAAGPLVSVALAAVGWSLKTLNPILHLPDAIYFMMTYMAYINTIMVVFNMIPGFPLDGGRIFRAILWKFTGNLKESTRIAATIGKLVGFAMIGWGIALVFIFHNPYNGLFFIIIAIFLIQAAQSSYQHVLLKTTLTGVKVKEVMSSPVSTINSWITVDELIHDYFIRHRFSSFPVIDEGVLKGIVTLENARQIPRMEWLTRRVSDILHPLQEGQMVTEEMDAIDAFNLMVRLNMHELLVMRDNNLIGVLTFPDLLSLFKMKTDLGE